MTLQESFAVLAAVLWALLWGPVGRVFGWWAGAGALLLGGFAGLLLGWSFGEWVNRSQSHSNWFRAAAEVSAVVAGWLVFVGLPLWVRSIVGSG